MRVYGKRGPGEVYRVGEFVRPWTPMVAELAAELARQPDFVTACLDWLRSNLIYEPQDWFTDYWQFPEETLAARRGDCEDSSILLCSLLRTRISHDRVFVTVGKYGRYGHAWVTLDSIVLEPTTHVSEAGMFQEVYPYTPMWRFNDLCSMDVLSHAAAMSVV